MIECPLLRTAANFSVLQLGALVYQVVGYVGLHLLDIILNGSQSSLYYFKLGFERLGHELGQDVVTFQVLQLQCEEQKLCTNGCQFIASFASIMLATIASRDANSSENNNRQSEIHLYQLTHLGAGPSVFQFFLGKLKIQNKVVQ